MQEMAAAVVTAARAEPEAKVAPAEMGPAAPAIRAVQVMEEMAEMED
jgi:hypothetical protein